VSCRVAECRGQQRLFGPFSALEHRDQAPGAHHADAVAHGHEFAQVAGHHQQRLAGVGHAVELGVEVGARAHVHAARGFVQQQHLAFAVQPARENHLLLVAAAERGNRLLDAARADAQQFHQLARDAAFLGAAQPPGVRDRAQVAQRGVDADRLRQQQALRLAVFGDQADARADRLHRRAPALADVVRGLPVGMQRDLAAVGAVCSEQQAHQLGPARADQAGQAHDFARAQVDVDVANDLRPADAARAQQHRSRHAAVATLVLVHRTAHHALHQFGFAHTGHGAHIHQPAVAQHRHAVGDALKLLEAVRDVDDGHAARLQQVDLLEQVRGFARREHGGGLVEHQHARVVLQVARDLHHLLLADAQPRHGRGRVDVLHADLGELARGQLVQPGLAYPAGLVGQAVEQQVLGHRQRGDEAELLHDHAHAQALRVAARGGREGLAVEQHPAARGLHQAADDLRQRALARAVLAREGQHFAGVEHERDVVQHRRRVVLAHGAQGEHGQGRCEIHGGGCCQRLLFPVSYLESLVTSTTSVFTSAGISDCFLFSARAFSAVSMPNTACLAANWSAVASTRPSFSIGLMAPMLS